MQNFVYFLPNYNLQSVMLSKEIGDKIRKD